MVSLGHKWVNWLIWSNIVFDWERPYKRTPETMLIYHCTLVTLGRLTDVSLNKNGGSREAVKNKGSVWVAGERIRSPFLTRRKITQKPNHSRNEFSLHLVFFEIFEIQNPVNWGLLKTVGRLTEQEPSGDWGLLVKWNLVAIPTFH